ncbi:MAG: hypothetical protein PHV51_07720 [Methanosarcinaceae archaeon]|nr:hypothetical protein [Methanosarcinaceae archaeon]
MLNAPDLKFPPSITVILPAFNEEVSIGSVVLLTKKYAERVLVIDDGSSDRTTDHTSDVAVLAGVEVIRIPASPEPFSIRYSKYILKAAPMSFHSFLWWLKTKFKMKYMIRNFHPFAFIQDVYLYSVTLVSNLFFLSIQQLLFSYQLREFMPLINKKGHMIACKEHYALDNLVPHNVGSLFLHKSYFSNNLLKKSGGVCL